MCHIYWVVNICRWLNLSSSFPVLSTVRDELYYLNYISLLRTETSYDNFDLSVCSRKFLFRKIRWLTQKQIQRIFIQNFSGKTTRLSGNHLPGDSGFRILASFIVSTVHGCYKIFLIPASLKDSPWNTGAQTLKSNNELFQFLSFEKMLKW